MTDAFNSIDLGSTDLRKKVALGLAAYGGYYFAKFAYSALGKILKYCVLPRKNLYERYGGGYALVTGASDGLGKEYARNLAKAGFDIVLMARDETKLGIVAAELRQEFKVQTVVIVYDFAKLSSLESVEELKAMLV